MVFKKTCTYVMLIMVWTRNFNNTLYLKLNGHKEIDGKPLTECNLSTLLLSTLHTTEIDERNLYRCSGKLLYVIMSSPDQYDDRKLLPS